MAARVAPEVAREIQSILPDSRYNEVAGAVTLPPGGIKKPARLPGTVALVCDNSAEAGVAEEAKLACAAMGCYAYKLGGAISDGSSAGGIPPNLIAAQSADVVVVISDCSDDAALPSLISSSVSSPVVLVPLARLEGGPPPGVTAVDVGNGVAAAIFAARILKSSARLRPGSN
jgi:NCAIR mutase (PurE)-related protein